MTTQGVTVANKQNPVRPPATHNVGTSGLPTFSAQAAASVLRLPLQNVIGLSAGSTNLERLGIPEGLHGIQTTNPQASMQLQGQTKLKTGHGKKTKGRVKIKMEFIDNKLRRYTTFSKRKAGLMKKAFELSTLTGTEVMLLVASETGHVYTFATRKLQPMITSEAGKALIQTCLNSPDLPSGSDPSAQSPLEHHMNLDGSFDDPEMGLTGSDDFDDGDYMDEEGDSSNESPSTPHASGGSRARSTSQTSTGVQNLSDDNGGDLRHYQEENYANLGSLEEFRGYSSVFDTGKHGSNHLESNGSYDAGEEPVYYDAVTPTDSTHEGV